MPKQKCVTVKYYALMTISYRFDGISSQLLNKYHLSFLTAFTAIKSQCNEQNWKGTDIV